ncbi:glutathione import ATP-binding protein GsiA [Treponema primitia ZAS-2]|uniref:Glutathione import ATP-binding protein GsiA n=1 Tax=Treponema primitia (strain ATCC BAA-887 / DSM 12427 / ZAS-2) TaxID=545694 RepID=F5YID0_TREPZ|nr:ATP-binding cassette domain-containing protein [Treponema primitia]AEF85665.1 glutathione import ATP-binding protein GsiA [Treponema primitia ZAS-2]
MKKFLLRLCRPEYRLGLLGALLLSIIGGVSILAPIVAPYNPFERSGTPFEKPDSAHILGCNDVGHDLLSELMYGGRISLSVGLFAAFYATAVAVIAALASGYFGGGLDRIIMRVVDLIMSLPFLPLVIVLGVFLGPGMGTQILVISLVMWAHPCRELRSQVMKTRNCGYIDAARAMGEKSWKIILRHTLPDLMPLIVPQFVLVAQSAILIESSLSFLGLGDPISKSWGSMLFFANTRAAFLTGAWVYWVLPPGLLISLSCLSFSLIGFSLAGKRGTLYSSYGSFKKSREQDAGERTAESLPLVLNNISVCYNTGHDEYLAVSGTSLTLRKKEVLGIVGESGCGKTTLAMTILGLLRHPAELTGGSVFIHGENMLLAGKMKILTIRGKTIAYVPQNAMNTLNPVVSLRKQLIEAIRIHRKVPRQEENAQVARLLDFVGIDQSRQDCYNHELSGGMKQRIVIAMALANNPDILIADEPTTGLDVLVQKSILDLLMELKDRLSISIILITHDLPLAMNYSDSLAVMYKGEFVDYGSMAEVYQHHRHFHTASLFNNFPRLDQPKTWVRDQNFGTERIATTVKLSVESDIPSETGPLKEAGLLKEALVVRSLSKTFYSRQGLFKKASAPIHAVQDVSFTLRPGEVLGLIGGSGSGKTTVSRLIMGLEKPDGGEIFLNGEALHLMKGAERARAARKIHLVFQDPYQSLHNNKTLFDIAAEPMVIEGGYTQEEMKERVHAALQDVHLPYSDAFLRRTPNELSGGQRQRLSFARAVVAKPRYIIADEPSSMLDASLRKELLKLMEELRSRYNMGYIFITHDLSLAYHFCDRLMVMHEGAVVEEADAHKLIHHPVHGYTRELISAVETPTLPAAAPDDSGYALTV